HINHAYQTLRSFEHNRSAAGRAIGIIHRTQQTGLGVDESENFFLIPDMVPSRYDRNTCPQEIESDFWSNPSSTRSVLAIYDNEIDRVLFLQPWQLRNHCAATWFAHHVTKKKNRQHSMSIVLNRRKSKP